MKGGIFSLILLTATVAGRAEQTERVPAIGEFYEVTAGHYQVLAQSGSVMGWQANRFMNEMLRQYSLYFSNWSLKAGARVVVFSNAEDFRAYSASAVRLTHQRLAGYCHLKTDEAGNTFYELVTYEDENLWRTLAHEGFHQFLGYELGLEVPMWLNEGLAQYFETSQVSRGRLRAGLVSRSKLRAAQYLILKRQAPSLTELIQMDRRTFYANGQVAYPMSWALVYYLLHRDSSSYRASAFRRYLRDLKLNRDDITSFERRFGPDSAQWQRDFERFIVQLKAHVD